MFRYKDRIQELKSEIEKFTKKKNDLNDKFKDDYKFAQKACDEKEMHEKKLKKEIADLLNVRVFVTLRSIKIRLSDILFLIFIFPKK